MPGVSPEGNIIFLVWQDNSTGNEEIFLRKSTNGGITFGNTTNVSNDTGISSSPQIESFGNSTFVIWQDNSTGNRGDIPQEEYQWRNLLLEIRLT